MSIVGSRQPPFLCLFYTGGGRPHTVVPYVHYSFTVFTPESPFSRFGSEDLFVPSASSTTSLMSPYSPLEIFYPKTTMLNPHPRLHCSLPTILGFSCDPLGCVQVRCLGRTPTSYPSSDPYHSSSCSSSTTGITRRRLRSGPSYTNQNMENFSVTSKNLSRHYPKDVTESLKVQTKP